MTDKKKRKKLTLDKVAAEVQAAIGHAGNGWGSPLFQGIELKV